MTLVDFLLLLVVAAIIGAIGEALGGYSPGGCAMSIVVGFAGAFIGRYIQKFFQLPAFFAVTVGGKTFPIVWSIIGAALLVAVLRLIQRRRGAV